MLYSLLCISQTNVGLIVTLVMLQNRLVESLDSEHDSHVTDRGNFRCGAFCELN